MPLLQLGLRPVPIDVELDTLNVSSRTLQASLDRAPIAALFLTDLLGWCADLDRLRALCADRDILLLEDACEALGSVYQGSATRAADPRRLHREVRVPQANGTHSQTGSVQQKYAIAPPTSYCQKSESGA